MVMPPSHGLLLCYVHVSLLSKHLMCAMETICSNRFYFVESSRIAATSCRSGQRWGNEIDVSYDSLGNVEFVYNTSK